MEEIWIISRLVVYSHLFYHNFLHQDFLGSASKKFHTMKNSASFGYEAPPSPQLNFLKGPHGDGRGQAALAFCRQTCGRFWAICGMKGSTAPPFFGWKMILRQRSHHGFFFGKKHRVVQQFWVVKNGFVPKTHSNLQATPPKNAKNDEFEHLKNAANLFFQVKTHILKHFLCKKSCRVFFFISSGRPGSKNKSSTALDSAVDEVMESRRGGWGFPVETWWPWGCLGPPGGRDVVTCWWFRNPGSTHQLRLAIYPIICKGLQGFMHLISGGWPWDFWTINRTSWVVWVISADLGWFDPWPPTPQNTGFFLYFLSDLTSFSMFNGWSTNPPNVLELCPFTFLDKVGCFFAPLRQQGLCTPLACGKALPVSFPPLEEGGEPRVMNVAWSVKDAGLEVELNRGNLEYIVRAIRSSPPLDKKAKVPKSPRRRRKRPRGEIGASQEDQDQDQVDVAETPAEELGDWRIDPQKSWKIDV